MRGHGVFCILLITAGAPAGAQDVAPGALFTLDTETRLTAGNDLPGDPEGGDADVTFTQAIDLGFLSETRTQTLGFDVDASLGCSNTSGCYGLTDRSANLSYSRTGSRSILSANADYALSTVYFGDVIPQEGDLFDPDALTAETGTVARAAFDTALVLGVDMPLGLTFGLNARAVDYEDVENLTLADQQQFGLSADMRLQLSPVLSAHILGDLSQFEADNDAETERTTAGLGVGASARIDGRTNLRADIRQSRITIEEGTGEARDSTRIDSTSFSLDATRETTDGDYTAALFLAPNDPFQRDRLTFGHTVTRPVTTLTYAVGVSETKDGVTGIGTLTVDRRLARGAFTLAASRSVSVDDEESDIILSQARAQRSYTVNSRTDVNLAARFTQIDDLSEDGETSYRATVGASLNRSLTRQWALALGVEASSAGQNFDDAEQVNSAFIALRRTVQWSR